MRGLVYLFTSRVLKSQLNVALDLHVKYLYRLIVHSVIARRMTRMINNDKIMIHEGFDTV